MEQEIAKVKRFNELGGLVLQDNFLDLKLLDLKLGLIQEELNEIAAAAKAGDIVEVLDGLDDLLYVTFGFAITYKLDTKLVESFSRVHDSNMSKFCITEDDAKKSVHNYYNIGVETYYKKVDDLYIIYRTSDNKILKGIDFQPVKLNDLCTN